MTDEEFLDDLRDGPSLVVVQLDETWDHCCVCGDEVPARQGIPMYEGKVVAVESKGPWAGFTACLDCFEIYEAGDYGELERIMADAEQRRSALCCGRLGCFWRASREGSVARRWRILKRWALPSGRTTGDG